MFRSLLLPIRLDESENPDNELALQLQKLRRWHHQNLERKEPEEAPVGQIKGHSSGVKARKTGQNQELLLGGAVLHAGLHGLHQPGIRDPRLYPGVLRVQRSNSGQHQGFLSLVQLAIRQLHIRQRGCIHDELH